MNKEWEQENRPSYEQLKAWAGDLRESCQETVSNCPPAEIRVFGPNSMRVFATANGALGLEYGGRVRVRPPADWVKGLDMIDAEKTPLTPFGELQMAWMQAVQLVISRIYAESTSPSMKQVCLISNDRLRACEESCKPSAND